MKVIKLEFDELGPQRIIVNSISDAAVILKGELEALQLGERVTVKVTLEEMDKEKFDSLPEFEGW